MKSNFKGMQDQSEVLKFIPSFTGTVQFWVDLKAWRTMLNRTTLFSSALYFIVALRASKT
jgi:hypothetical protein